MLNKKRKIKFIIIENIYNHNRSEILIKNNFTDIFYSTGDRHLQSYIHEFCGKYDIEFEQINIKVNLDISLSNIITKDIELYISNVDNTIENSYFINDCLFNLEKYTYFYDLKLKVQNKIYKLHKCILSSRSKYFKYLLLYNDTNYLELKKTKLFYFNYVIDWIYYGDLSDKNLSYNNIIKLIQYTDYYILNDMKKRCEQNLLYLINENNVIDIMTTVYKIKNIINKELLDYCYTIFIEENEKINKRKMAKKIIKQKGLLTDIIIHNNKNNIKIKKQIILSRMQSKDSSKDEHFFN